MSRPGGGRIGRGLSELSGEEQDRDDDAKHDQHDPDDRLRWQRLRREPDPVRNTEIGGSRSAWWRDGGSRDLLRPRPA